MASSSSSESTPPPPKSSLIDPPLLIASSTSAISARLLTHPLDTLRIRIQTYPGSTLPPLKDLVPRPHVIRGLYAGLPVALVFSVPALSVYLTAYEATKKYLGTKVFTEERRGGNGILAGLPIFLASGMAAEVASGAIWTPMDVMKARLQKGGEGSNSAVKLLGKIWREEGYRGVWRGYWMSLAVFGPYVSLYWMLYETFKTHYIPNYDPYAPPNTSHGLSQAYKYTLCSASACGIAACITNPVDVVQSRWQTSRGKLGGGIGGIVREMWRNGGLKSFWRGVGSRVVYSVPSNAVSMTTFEMVRRLWTS